MITSSGYSLEKKISENKRAMIFRGFREKDNLPVIIKLLNKECHSPSDVKRFTREYNIISKFNSEGIIKARKLVRHQHTLFMILEDFDGIPVNNLIRNIRLNLKDLLLLSIHITTILGRIHQRNIIHKDIQPSHFLWDPKTASVKLVDFGISVESLQNNQNEINPNLMEGTFQYMSPEQTGRVNRGIDYRTDFYSLGVTLYEIFMNRLPFDSDDPTVLVHSHIAHTPQPPFAVNRNVPPILSDIVMKLMAKAPEDRYQTAFGLRYDLEKCYEQLIAGGTIVFFRQACLNSKKT
jgi:histidine kinase